MLQRGLVLNSGSVFVILGLLFNGPFNMLQKVIVIHVVVQKPESFRKGEKNVHVLLQMLHQKSCHIRTSRLSHSHQLWVTHAGG